MVSFQFFVGFGFVWCVGRARPPKAGAAASPEIGVWLFSEKARERSALVLVERMFRRNSRKAKKPNLAKGPGYQNPAAVGWLDQRIR
jgi:hypothetical protein